METLSRLKATAASFGTHPLLISPDGHAIDVEHGYIPLLADFTFEDKAAKGLRKRTALDRPEPAVYFSALELVRDNRILLLTGSSGSGKTTFAKYLCWSLALAGRGKSVIRNELGVVHEERWDANVVPCYFAVGAEDLRALIEDTIPSLLQHTASQDIDRRELLIVIDAVEKAGDHAPVLLEELVSLVIGFDHVRLLALSDAKSASVWAPPPGFAQHSLLPLLESQRREAVARLVGCELNIATGSAAANPSLFALAVQARHSGARAEDILDSWLAVVAPDAGDQDTLAYEAYQDISRDSLLAHQQTLLLSHTSTVRQLLAARHLATLPPDAAIQFYHSNPIAAEPVIRSLLRVSAPETSHILAKALINGTGELAQRGALLVSTINTLSSSFNSQIATHMLNIVTAATLSITERTFAGRVLSSIGDPRPLTALANIPEGTFTLGSNAHANSTPPSEVTLNAFKIGIYPVINRDYALFIHETGRPWSSPDGFHPERQNAPATDLSWYDARAYCLWLTAQWRRENKISETEHVRLPSEAEWERAASPLVQENNLEDELNTDLPPIYPWGTSWTPNRSNSEETALNTTCAVGLFPLGVSSSGCHDMAGQVWEWCSTVWGSDMTTPSFKYPYTSDDGREDLDAPGDLRRVLRGGCFSSGKLKACSTYRGSLEPGGSWRGNGFRVVVAKQGATVLSKKL